MISPPPIPVPTVSITALRVPLAAPKRCSASAAQLASLSIETGTPSRSAEPLADRHVGDRQVDRGDRDARARGRSCRGSRARLRRRLGVRRAPRATSRTRSRSAAPRSARPKARVSPVEDLALGSDDPDEHLGAAEIDAHGLDCRSSCGRRGRDSGSRRIRRAVGMIFSAFHDAGSRRPGPERPPSSPERSGPPERQPQGDPEYKVYRSRRGLRRGCARPTSPSCASGPGARRGAAARGRRSEDRPDQPEQAAARRRILKWVAIAAGAWLLLSFLAFAVSAQLQKWKLADAASEALERQPLPARQPADDPRHRHRRADARRAGAGRRARGRSASTSRRSGEPPTADCSPGSSAPTR